MIVVFRGALKLGNFKGIMKQILKRLEIIKSCIAIEDEETVAFQVEKLYELEIDDQVKSIILMINNTDFQKVIPLIDEYIRQFTSLVVYEDEEIQGLKLELKILEKQLLVYSCKVEEYHALINDFNAMYHKKLGLLLEEILILREEYYEFMYQHNESFEAQYYEAKKDFEDFHEEFKKFAFDNPIELSKKDKKELKRIYKKASRMCHPDIVDDEKKQKAELIFKELNAAYQHNDLKKVAEILDQLLTGESFSITSDSVNDIKILRQKIDLTRQKIKSIKLEIDAIKRNETFVLVQKVDDIDEYLDEIKMELQEEKETILNKMREYSQTV